MEWKRNVGKGRDEKKKKKSEGKAYGEKEEEKRKKRERETNEIVGTEFTRPNSWMDFQMDVSRKQSQRPFIPSIRTISR